MGPVRAGGKTVEGDDHLENYFSLAHVGRDLAPRVNSSLVGAFGDQVDRSRLAFTRQATCFLQPAPTQLLRRPSLSALRNRPTPALRHLGARLLLRAGGAPPFPRLTEAVGR